MKVEVVQCRFVHSYCWRCKTTQTRKLTQYFAKNWP